MNKEVKGNASTVLVTGAMGGIGQALCSMFARQAFSVVVHDIHEETSGSVTSFLHTLKEQGASSVRYCKADLSSMDDIDSMFHGLDKDGVSVDVLVNNASIQKTMPIEDFDAETWSSVLSVNLTAVYRCIHHVVPAMKKRQWGRIINIASAHGLVGSVHKAAYVAAKHGVVGLTKVVALENAKQGITANSICPGWTETPLLEPQINARVEELGVSRDEAIYDLVIEKQPSGTLIDPSRIAGLASYLASDVADNVTGTAIPIDSGWTCQ